MIAYFDTSAVVPLLVEEPSTGTCQGIWESADSLVTTRLLFVETAAALAHAGRIGRLSVEAHESALAGLEVLWQQLDVVELTEALVRRAADLARLHGLRGYDAVHCAAAASMEGPTLVAVSGDRELLVAWQSMGISRVDTQV